MQVVAVPDPIAFWDERDGTGTLIAGDAFQIRYRSQAVAAPLALSLDCLALFMQPAV
jgi:hypothetical protein